MDNFIVQLGKDIFEQNGDLCQDYLQLGLDEVLDSKILENIPVVKTFVSLIKTVNTVQERFFAQKLLIFATSIHRGTVSEGELTKRRDAIKNNNSEIKKEVEQIIIFLDKFDFAYKAEILAKLYIAFINGVISSDKYLNMLPIIDKWHQGDKQLLKILYDLDNQKALNLYDSDRDGIYLIDLASQQRLKALGVLGLTYEVEDISYMLDDDDDECPYCIREKRTLNPEGRILSEILFEDEVKTHFDKHDFTLTSM